MKVPIKKIDTSLSLPRYEKNAAWCDLTCAQSTTIAAGEIKAVPAGIAIQVPQWHVLFIFPRSSTSSRKWLLLANSVGVVDPFYNGDDNEIMLLFYNFTQETVSIKKWDKLVQAILIKTEQIEREEQEFFQKSSRPTRRKKENFVK